MRRSFFRTVAAMVVAAASLVLISGTVVVEPASAVTTTTLSTACQSQLATFTAAAAGVYSSTALTIAFASAVTLTNPASAGSRSASQTVTLPFVVYGATGAVQVPTVASPVTVSIYGAPRGAVTTSPAALGSAPLVVTVTSDAPISLTYSGVYLSRPLTVVASTRIGTTNVCTGTASYAIGSTTLALATATTTLGTASYSTPTRCYKETTGAACATHNVATAGLSFSAAAGYGAAVPGSAVPRTAARVGQLSTYTVDTGSIGAVVPLARLGPDVIGPGAPALKYYDSSGNEFIGFVYLAPITLQMGSGRVVTDPVRMLAVVSSACHPGKSCKKAPAFKNFHYLGVGFDRDGSTAADPFASPTDNALLAVEAPPGATFSQGYILSGASITVGITATDSAGASLVDLSPDSVHLGDWLGSPGCVSFPTSSTPTPLPACGRMLFDVGVPEMFITFSSSSVEPAVVAGGLGANQNITVDVPNGAAPALSFTFSSGPVAGGKVPPAVAMAPSKVGLSVLPGGVNAVFVNTGRHILFEQKYLFDAQTGQVGFIPVSPPLR